MTIDSSFSGFASIFDHVVDDKSGPLSLTFKSAQTTPPTLSTALPSILSGPAPLAQAVFGTIGRVATLATFNSYSFERNILSPSAPFRFTAPGISKEIRKSIRSGDTVQLLVTDRNGKKVPIATGFIDETDTHGSSTSIEYVLTGRDTMGQLVDNTAVDKSNKLQNIKTITMKNLAKQLLLNTRIPQGLILKSVDTSPLLFRTNPGETKMATLQRYMEYTNCVAWTAPNGQIILGKPSFNQTPSGTLIAQYANVETKAATNVLDFRVRRNVNSAIRQIILQLQSLTGIPDQGNYTYPNEDADVKAVAESLAGRSVYEVFTYGKAEVSVNKVIHVANSSGSPTTLGQAYALRRIARENVNVLDVELTVKGHLNSEGGFYDVDQVYNVSIPDEDLSQPLYVYAVTYSLTIEHGMMTKLRLCKLGTIVANSAQVQV